MDDQSEHLLGRFWFAGQPEVTLPGWLDLSGPRPVITIAGQLTAPVAWTEYDGGLIGEATTSEFPSELHALHGELSAGLRRNVTMLNADSYPTSLQMFGDLGAGSSNGTEEFVGEWLIRGAHAEPDGPILKARMRFTYIDEWAHKSGIHLRDQSYGDGRPVDLSYREPSPIFAEIPNGRGSLRVCHHRGIPRYSPSGATIQHQAWVEIHAESTSLSDLFNDFIDPILNFVSIMMDRPCRATRVEVMTTPGGYYDRVYHPLIREDHEIQPIKPHERYILLPHIELGVLAHWITQCRHLDPIPSIIAGSLGRDSGRFIENDLLELASCAEGLDRRMHGEESIFNEDTIKRIRETVEYWVRVGLGGEIGYEAAFQVARKLQYFEPTYRERLERLVEYTQECTPEAAGVAKAWTRTLVGARNDFAHLLPDSTTSWKTNLILLESLKWILGAALMRQAGISPTVIKARLKAYTRYAFFIRKAKNYAPTIYEKNKK